MRHVFVVSSSTGHVSTGGVVSGAENHLPDGLAAKTIQFQAILLNGAGSLIPAAYGPRQIATHTDIVNVGATYILICDIEASHPNHHHAFAGFGGRTGIGHVVGAANTGNHLSSKTLHPKTLIAPGARSATLNGTGSHHPPQDVNHLHAH